MKTLILGASGFIGRNVETVLNDTHEVICSSTDRRSPYFVDLSDLESVKGLLKNVQPDAVINCAGVVDPSQDTNLNVTFTRNLLEAVQYLGIRLKKIVVIGSAAEYGLVDTQDIPVNEEVQLKATSGYGLSKLHETKIAQEFSKKPGLPVVVAMIFNPIGSGMHSKLLLPQLIQQIQAIEGGGKSSIEVNRLDSLRDYIHVKDVALAIKALVENNTKVDVYNIGSGKSTSNKELVELILKNSKLVTRPELVEMSVTKEPPVACQADISRIKHELGWFPQFSVEQAVKEVIDATS